MILKNNFILAITNKRDYQVGSSPIYLTAGKAPFSAIMANIVQVCKYMDQGLKVELVLDHMGLTPWLPHVLTS